MLTYSKSDIAVIGVSGRFPNSNTINEFWEHIKNGDNCIERFLDQELAQKGIENHENFVPARGILSDVKKFDAEFFGFSELDATILDPQQRLFIECSWELFENACYDPIEYDGRIGVFASTGLSHYLIRHCLNNSDLMRHVDEYQLLLANDKDFLATRVSYLLNLTGPSINVQTGCSSSAVAIHLARQSLLNGECEMALAGGVSITLPQVSGYVYKKGGIGSPDGACRPFDINAQGTVKSNGVALVLLKPIEAALADNDHIYSVIKSTAVNNDGRHKIGYTAPSIQQQSAVIEESLKHSGVSAQDIGYVEAHGTATNLGDPIEIKALKKAYLHNNDAVHTCAIGSLKANFGHLDVAAGAAGVIKSSLALKNEFIPPLVNFTKENPKLKTEQSPFYFSNTGASWVSKKPRYAAVSSFGVGGTNVHVILGEANKQNRNKCDTKIQLIPLSAKCDNALNEFRKQILTYLENNKDFKISDLAHSLQSRHHFSIRNYLVAESNDEAISLLQSDFSINSADKPSSIVFMFSGQGSQHKGMTKSLYESNPFFRETFDRLCEYGKKYSDVNFKDIIFNSDLNTNDDFDIDDTIYAQPCLFIVEYSIAKLLIELGVKPTHLIGHSIGEYAAAAIAKIMSEENALKLVIHRGRLVQSLPRGDMLTVMMGADEVKKYLDENSEVAVENTPQLTTISGTVDAISQIEQNLNEKNIFNRRLQTSHAFHSFMLEPILEEFKSIVRTIPLSKPTTPLISNVTGGWLTENNASSPEYWVSQLRHAVKFSQGMSTLREIKNPIFVEVGPGTALTTIASHHGIKRVFNTQPHPREQLNDYNVFLKCLGELYCSGASLNWSELDSDGVKQPLPNYAWQKRIYWVTPDENVNTSSCDEVIKECGNSIKNLDEYLTEKMSQVLGSKKLKADSNFFEMGGDSLAAVNFIDKLEAEIKNEISVLQLFEYPTPTLLSQYLRNREKKSVSTMLDEAEHELSIYELAEEI